MGAKLSQVTDSVKYRATQGLIQCNPGSLQVDISLANSLASSLPDPETGEYLLLAVDIINPCKTALWKRRKNTVIKAYTVPQPKEIPELDAPELCALTVLQFYHLFFFLSDYSLSFRKSLTVHKGKAPAAAAECVICMQNHVDIALDCAHAYCSECIDKWSDKADTCPICRQESTMSDDRWVLAEAPDPREISRTLFSFVRSYVNDPALSEDEGDPDATLLSPPAS